MWGRCTTRSRRTWRSGWSRPAAAADQAVSRLKQLPGEPLDPRALPDRATAREQIVNRDIDGALVIDPAGTTDTLLVASGGGKVLANTLIALITGVEKDRRAHGEDRRRGPGRRHRTPTGSPPSTWSSAGAWAAICARRRWRSARARGPPTPGARRSGSPPWPWSRSPADSAARSSSDRSWEPCPGSVWALWGLGALITFAVGAATLAFQCLFGIIGIGVAVLLVVILGNPSAGGALPPPMLPPFWKAIGPALPPGAGTWAARSIAYFKGNDTTASLLVLSAWAAVGSAVTLVGRLAAQGRTSNPRPAEAHLKGAGLRHPRLRRGRDLGALPQLRPGPHPAEGWGATTHLRLLHDAKAPPPRKRERGFQRTRGGTVSRSRCPWRTAPRSPAGRTSPHRRCSHRCHRT